MSEHTEPAGLAAISTRRTVGDLVGTVWRCARGPFVTSFVEHLSFIGSSLLPLVAARLIDALVEPRSSNVWGLVALLAVLCTTQPWTMVVAANARTKLMNRVGHVYSLEVVRNLSQIRHLEDLEDPTFRDHTQLATTRAGLLGTALNRWILAGRDAIQVVVMVVVAALISPWLLLIPLAGIWAMVQQQRIARREGAAEDESAETDRHKDALLRALINPAVHDEVVLWQAGDFLRGRLAGLLQAWRTPLNRFARRQTGMGWGPNLVQQLVTGAVLALITWQAFTGRVALGAVAGALLMVSQLSSLTVSVQSSLGFLMRSTRAAKRVLWLRDYTAAHQGTGAAGEAGRVTGAAAGGTGPAGAGVAGQAARPATGLRPNWDQPPAGRATRMVAEHLSYRYPGATSDALHDVTLDIPARGSIALVGANGSGKTTFLDLLLGLRQPSAGWVGWLDAAGQPVRPRASATFQDYVRYEATLHDNVTFGDWQQAGTADEPLIQRGLQQVDLARLWTQLPDGSATQLGQRWEDSRGLSGGQWQRIAIARCLYPSLRGSGAGGSAPAGSAAAPQVRVLDEASSALDAAAEERLRSIILGAELPGDGVTIYVTHRFPIIRSADVILVFDHSRLVEQGNHDQLLAQDGAYAELFNAQARGYESPAP
jgi:ABC-type multidrug transport system fused ATPase/permease subunit